MEANYFTILYWFCHTSTWIHHGCTCVPHPEPTSHLPLHTIPLIQSEVSQKEKPQYSILTHYMEFIEMVTITLYVRQKKRHRCIEQSFGLCGRGRGWDDLGGWHWNMYNIICETNHQSRFDAWYRMLGAGTLGWHFFLKWPRVSVILVSQASFIFHSCFLNSKPFFTSGYWLFQTLAVISLSSWWDKGH